MDSTVFMNYDNIKQQCNLRNLCLKKKIIVNCYLL